MPLYEYVCNDCDTRFDTLVPSFRQADQVTCAQCSSGSVRRLVSTFAGHVSGHDGAFSESLTPTGAGGCCGGSCGCGHA